MDQMDTDERLCRIGLCWLGIDMIDIFGVAGVKLTDQSVEIDLRVSFEICGVATLLSRVLRHWRQYAG